MKINFANKFFEDELCNEDIVIYNKVLNNSLLTKI